MISTPGDVGQLDYDASGKLARSKAAIDRVVHEDFCCCKKNCTRVWKLAFGWKPNAWDDEGSVARSTIEVLRLEMYVLFITMMVSESMIIIGVP